LLEARAGARAWSAPRSRVERAGVSLIDAEAVATLPVPALPEFDAARLVRGEMQATGLWFSGDPLATMVPAAARRGTVPAASLPQHVGRRVAVLGLPCAYRRVETRRGERMLFMTLADQSGLAECVLFPDGFRAYAAAVHGQVVRAEGRVDETLGAVTLAAERAAPVVT
jgi:DNA polymerase III alpha subunit